jgi:hypothetical protein
MNARRSLSKLQRGLYLSVAAAFWFFLAASAPHRVHHFLKQSPAVAGHHTDGGEQHNHADHHDRKPSQQSDCVVLSVAQNAHASIVHSFSVSVLECAVARRPEQPVVTALSFNPAPFSQRAPPLV